MIFILHTLLRQKSEGRKKTYMRVHGLRTPNEAIFQQYLKLLGLGQTNWAEMFWGISGQTKGQLISKCPYEKSVSSKIPTKKIPRFLP